MNVHCFDTSALVEITHAGLNAAKFAQALAKAETVIISTVSIYEIAHYTKRSAQRKLSDSRKEQLSTGGH